ncbi:MAG: cation:proton antiporter [Terracidiphilus sp.]|nr:cation:proton antiporter [Terracidiphilus sp.]
MNELTNHLTQTFLELGAATLVLAVLARVSSRWSFSAIPLYLIAGLAFGNGGLMPLNFSHEFIQIGAEIGVLLLLFMLGLEYSGDHLRYNLRAGAPAGLADFVLNFPPGLIAGLLLGWGLLPAVLLGGVTFISSSGIVARVLSENQRMACPETPIVLAILVIEDLVMAIYLPLVAVLIAGGGPQRIAISVAISVSAVIAALFVAVRFGRLFSGWLNSESDEVVLLSTFGTVLLVAGLAQKVQVSSAIGAFLVGIAFSGPMAEKSHRIVAPLRDLFAATFFFFFGLEVDPHTLPPVLAVAAALAVVTTLTKVATGMWSTRNGKLSRRARLRAGLTLVAHGEFSIVIAGLGVALEPRLGALSAAYVLLMAALGPIAARLVR